MMKILLYVKLVDKKLWGSQDWSNWLTKNDRGAKTGPIGCQKHDEHP